MNSALTFHLLVFEACYPFSPHLKWTGGGGRGPVAVAICTKQHIFSLVQQHPYLVVVPLLILLLYKFYPKNKTKFNSVLIANSLLHVYYYWIIYRPIIPWLARANTTLCSGHHLGEGSRCQVPATDSQQGLQVGVDLLQVVEPLVPGKQHFQMLIMSKLDHKLIERRREEEKLLWGCSLFHPQWQDT